MSIALKERLKNLPKMVTGHYCQNFEHYSGYYHIECKGLALYYMIDIPPFSVSSFSLHLPAAFRIFYDNELLPL